MNINRSETSPSIETFDLVKSKFELIIILSQLLIQYFLNLID